MRNWRNENVGQRAWDPKGFHSEARVALFVGRGVENDEEASKRLKKRCRGRHAKTNENKKQKRAVEVAKSTRL